MAVAFVLDEDLRGQLWYAVQTHNQSGSDIIDVVRVGDPPDLPLGSKDPDILNWAEQENRILVTRDHKTMIDNMQEHLNAGRHSPGVFLVREKSGFNRVVGFLVAATYCSDPWEWQDKFAYIP